MTDMKINTFIAIGLLATSSSETMAQDAKQILDASSVQGGLVVVVGCDSPAMVAELRANDSYLVHGLDRDPQKVKAARTYLLEKGIYGSVTAAQWDGSQLPFVDSLVNLVVASGESQVPNEEIARVLAPDGVAVQLDPETRNLKPDAFFRKPRPAEIDGWTHFLHDASNNAVSSDTVVEPPRGLRWTCGPEYARSHEHFSSMSAMVTAGGRVFYIIDEGPISSVYLPPKWKLVARDAFSGVLLWDRPITNWEAHLRGFRSGPPEIGRRLVATGDRVYVALDYGEPVSVLDAATGEELSTVANTEGARELLLAGGTLFVLADDMTMAQHNQRSESINQEFLRTDPKLTIWQRLQRKAYPIYGAQRVVAAKTDSGELLWKQEFKESGEILPTTMAVDDGKVCLQTVSHVICLDASEGKELWRNERPVARSRFSWSTPTLVMHDGVVLILDRAASDNVGKSPPDKRSEWIVSSGGRDDRQDGELVTYSLDDGKELWRAAYSENYNTPGDVFVIGGVVWVGNLRGGGDPGFTQGRDLKTGEITATIPPQKAWGHHRCYRNKATLRWLMVGRGGIQYIDPVSGSVKGDSWYRGSCQYGAMPANGLVYVPQHSCACQPEELLIGLNALSPQSSAGEGPSPLEKGPAYEQIGNRKSAIENPNDWPTYRRDARRSGFQDLPAPCKPEAVWTTKLSSPITAPVTAGGLVFVAETDRHTLHALSAVDGKSVWTFVADGRIDSPPTLSGGRCLFGTRSGFVYCLQASDGELIWRFRAAPQDRRLFAYEQLESAWPVHGSVLVDGDGKLSDGVATAYFAAGRSSRIDGGIRLYALEVNNGKLLHQADVKVPDGPGANIIRQSVLPDIFSIQKDTVWMRNLGVDKNLAPVEDLPHLFAPRGFLDDTWWHRTYWVYGTEIGGGYTHWPDAGNAVPAGRLLVFDGGEHIYGYGRLGYRQGDGHVRPDGIEDYKLFAEVLTTKPQTRKEARGEERQTPGRREIIWAINLPFVAKSIVLTRDALLVAGGQSLPDTTDRGAPGILWIASRKDGAKQEDCPLPAPPALDGMALTDSGILVSMMNGSVACLQSSKKRAEGSQAENRNSSSADGAPASQRNQPDRASGRFTREPGAGAHRLVPSWVNSLDAKFLAQIDAMDLPEGYRLGKEHQKYVDRRLAELSPQQRGRIGQLWREKQRIDPNMPNRGFSFVRILAFVAGGEKRRPPSPQPSPVGGKGNSDAGKRASAVEGPNVLFLAVDDLNDWVGCLGGHPQAKTPNIDRLAEKGVLFEQAYCAAPLCSPSRTAIMTGLRPSTTGIYGNLAWFRDIPKYKDWETIPQYFRKHGYAAVTGGKIYHQPHGKFSDPIAWDQQYSTQMGTPFPPKANRYQHGMHDLFSNKILARPIDWGPIEQQTEQTSDWKTADKAAQFLQQEHDRPFFLACGIYHPHLPWYVPQKYFDMHPLESIELPARRENDLDDIPPVGLRMAGKAFNIIKERGQWKNAVRGRLASGSFADDCVGHVLNALENSKHRDNTIVVLWGDHGYDIGQKEFAKSALWEQTSRTPLIIYAPGVSKSGGRCKRPVSLVDLYPTLIELCGLPDRDDLDGRSLAPLMRNPETGWPFPAIITHSPHWHGTNHAIRSERYHYIRYSDGGEELYDMSNDPNQWSNLAGDPECSEVKKELKAWLPKVNARHFRPEPLTNR